MPAEQPLLELIRPPAGVLATITGVVYPHRSNVLYLSDGQKLSCPGLDHSRPGQGTSPSPTPHAHVARRRRPLLVLCRRRIRRLAPAGDDRPGATASHELLAVHSAFYRMPSRVLPPDDQGSPPGHSSARQTVSPASCSTRPPAASTSNPSAEGTPRRSSPTSSPRLSAPTPHPRSPAARRPHLASPAARSARPSGPELVGLCSGDSGAGGPQSTSRDGRSPAGPLSRPSGKGNRSNLSPESRGRGRRRPPGLGWPRPHHRTGATPARPMPGPMPRTACDQHLVLRPCATGSGNGGAVSVSAAGGTMEGVG